MAPRKGWAQFAWFVAIWGASVLALLAVSLAIRLVLVP